MSQYPAGSLKLTIYVVISSQGRIELVQTSDLYKFGCISIARRRTVHICLTFPVRRLLHYFLL